MRQIENSLSREEYLTWLLGSDIILLPYDPIIYRMATSGIFVEAVCAGKIPLVKKGSWLAHELIKFDLTELIVDWENPLFFSHLTFLIKSVKIREKLEIMQLTYQQFHSVESFSMKMHEIMQSSLKK